LPAPPENGARAKSERWGLLSPPLPLLLLAPFFALQFLASEPNKNACYAGYPSLKAEHLGRAVQSPIKLTDLGSIVVVKDLSLLLTS